MICKLFRPRYYFLLFCIISLPAGALSLGEIDVKSHFAEPFLAEISIPSFTDEEIDTIQINLASNKQHESMGYIATEATRRFNFAIKEKIDGSFYIRVKSELSVKELSISLLVEIISASGRIVKGYDILLTPAALIKKERRNSPVKLIEPQTKIIPNKLIPPVKASTKISNKPVKLSHVKALPDGSFEYLNVGSGETLSTVAQAIRPDKSIHINQVVAALHRQNPSAFLNNNINRLKMGANLKLLSTDSIVSLSPFKAYEYIQQQSHSANRPKKNALLKTRQPEKIIVSERKKNFLPASVKGEEKTEEIQNIKAELGLAQKITKDLENKNEDLVGLISKLEIEIKKMTESLIQEPDEIMIQSIIKDPLIVRSKPATAKNESNFIEKNLTMILIFSIGILVFSIILAKKKESIKSYFENNKAKKDQNIFN